MDIRKMSLEARKDPKLMAENYLEKHSEEYLENQKFLNKTYSLEEIEDLSLLFKHCNKGEDFVLSLLKVTKIKELKNIDYLIEQSLEEYADDYDNNDLWGEEILKQKFEEFLQEDLDLETEFNLEEKLLKLEKVFDELKEKTKKPDSYKNFKANILKKKEVVKLSSHLLKSKKINNSSQLNLTKPVSLLPRILMSKIFLSLLPLEKAKEVVQIKKRKKESKAVLKPELKLKMR